MELTRRGQDVLHRVKSKLGIPTEASVDDCVLAFLQYSEFHDTLDLEESRLMLNLAANELVRRAQLKVSKGDA